MPVVITREFIEKNKSSRGGWNNSQLVMLGESWPPKRGWLEKAIGREISDEAAANFVKFGQERPNKKVRAEIREKARGRLKAEKVKALDKKLRGQSEWSPRRFSTDPTGEAFLASYEWRRVRMMALKKHGATCQCCGASPKTGAVMNVDHIKPRRLFPQLALDVDNLQVLCHECNHGKGNWDQTDWREPEADPEVVAMLRDIARNG
jgi:5-methylcytosine-specific restriction endonuclease McrA